MEAVAALVNNALFVVIYRPPSYTMQIFIDSLARLLQEIQSLEVPSVIVGDFNTNISQICGSTLVRKFEEYGLQQLVDYPTTEGGTCLDLVFVKGFRCTTKLIPTYYGYHDAVHIRLE